MHIITKEVIIMPDNITETKTLIKEDFLIFDIETNGFSRRDAIIYMIGCIYKKNDHYEYCNLFASSPSKEYDLICYFFNMLKKFHWLVHFNGNNFDIPFLLARAKQHGITETISPLKSLDIYDILRPYRKSLNLPNLKLATLQNKLGYVRKDTTSGGDLIPIYHAYVKKAYKPYYELLLLHNREDVEEMLALLPLIDIFIFIERGTFEFVAVNQANKTIEVSYTLPYKVGIDFQLSLRDCRLIFSSGSKVVKFILPLCPDKKKRFFENYKDYMYIPEKDQVVHRTIASFMPTCKKIKAKKSNCYISHQGVFIPIFNVSNAAQPFKDNFKSKDYYTVFNLDLDSNFFKQELIEFLKACKNF